MPDSVTIGICADDKLDFLMVRDLTNLIGARWNEIGGRLIWANGDVGRLDEGRNRVADVFMRGPTDWLLWIDTDMTFTPTDFDNLLRRGKQGSPIVSGLYYRASDPPTPCMFRYKDGQQRVVKDFPKNGVISVDAAGFGFMLTHRDVLAKMAVEGFNPTHPWFDNGQVGPNGQTLADDTSFCFRAKSIGFDILVDTSVKLGHIKPVALRG